MEDMGYLMENFCIQGGEGLYATHVDISNCYWGFKLPPDFSEAFRLEDPSGEGG